MLNEFIQSIVSDIFNMYKWVSQITPFGIARQFVQKEFDFKIQINIEDQGSVVTLKMIGLISAGAGTAPSMTQKLGDVCTWIIATKCDAPVITVGATSTALTLATLEWSIQILEWDEELLSTNTW